MPGYQLRNFSKSRHAAVSLLRLTEHKPIIHGLIEADVTLARQTLREAETHTGRTLLRPVENFICRLGGVRSAVEISWTTCPAALITFNAAGFLFLLGLQLTERARGLAQENETEGLGVLSLQRLFYAL